MPRLTSLDDVLFPVAAFPLFASVTDRGEARPVPASDWKAIVNTRANRVLGVVGGGYRLVSNEEALALARECCRLTFPETQASEWTVSATDAPGTGSYCHIDLRHSSTALDFFDVPKAERPETYGPFIRVTNSYNRVRALAFDIGFYRKVCSNGLIVPSSIITFKFIHSRAELKEANRFDIDREKLARLKSEFGSLIAALKEFPLSGTDFQDLVLGVLALRPPSSQHASAAQFEDWDALMKNLEAKAGRYSEELGWTAYSALNVITDFASHPPANRCVHRERHSLQRRAGSWLNSFAHECKKSTFDLRTYLDKLAADAQSIQETADLV